MRKKPIIALMLTVVMLFAVVAPVMARTPEQIQADTQYLYDQVAILEESGMSSNEEITSLFVDLTDISVGGNVILSVYEEVDVTPTNTNSITVSPLPWKDAEQELIKYSLGNIANLYRQEPYNTETTCKTYQPDGQPRDIIPFYAYGPCKSQAIAELFNGIPSCFTIQYLPPTAGGGGDSGYSGNASEPVTPIPTPVAHSYSSSAPAVTPEPEPEPEPEPTVTEVLETVFTVNSTKYSTSTLQVTSTANEDTTEIVDANAQTSDVSPYIKNNRTYVPVRYLAHSLGVDDNDITWTQDVGRVSLIKGETTIVLLIGSHYVYVNKKPTKMDVAPEITNGRTMLPARWVAEALGAEVTWDDDTKQTIIKMPTEQPGD